MSSTRSVLAELEGLSGENLLTRALGLLIEEDIAVGEALWVSKFFLGGEGSPQPTGIKPEKTLTSSEGKSLGRVDMVIESSAGPTAVEVKLDAAFQEGQLERYAQSEVVRLCVLMPEHRRSEPQMELADGRGSKREVYTRTWQELLNELHPLASNEGETAHLQASLRRAFLRTEIRRYYESYYRLFNEAEVKQLQQNLCGIDSSEKAARESRLLDGIRRLPALRGLSPRIASAAHYIGFELARDDKDRGPLGWIGFVNTAKYKLNLSREGEVVDRGWRMVLCRATDCPGAHRADPDNELGLRHATLVQSDSIKGITRHAQPDDEIFEVPKLSGNAGSIKLEELWNQRVLAVFGDLAAAQPS